MLAPMGRRRTRDLDLPPLMYRKVRGGHTRYYYGKAGIAIGGDLHTALRKYAELHSGHVEPGTFEEAVECYRRDELASKAAATQTGYDRQLDMLLGMFRQFRLDEIRPQHVSAMLKECGKKRIDEKGRRHGGKIIATRLKALLSALFNFARASGLTDVPNPCAGIRGTKALRKVYVTDESLASVLPHCGRTLAAFLELAYRTGADPSVVLRLRRADVRDGYLNVRRTKTDVPTRIDLVGPLKPLVEALLKSNPPSLYLIAEDGAPLNLQAMRKRFWKARKAAGATWQLRDMRSKAGSDADDLKAAQALLGHASEATTAIYRRRRIGERAKPIMRRIAK